jgi:hypothetical protein
MFRLLAANPRPRYGGVSSFPLCGSASAIYEDLIMRQNRV